VPSRTINAPAGGFAFALDAHGKTRGFAQPLPENARGVRFHASRAIARAHDHTRKYGAMGGGNSQGRNQELSAHGLILDDATHAAQSPSRAYNG
jgi:hypothetical protein